MSASIDTSFLTSTDLNVSDKLNRLSKIGLTARLKSVRQLSPDQQSTLWRAHWQRWLAAGGLTKKQADIVRRAFDRATPQQYAKSYVDPKSTALWREAAAVFTPAQYEAVLRYIGQRPGEALPPARPWPGRLTVWTVAVRTMAALGRTIPTVVPVASSDGVTRSAHAVGVR
jgi:hypothetical protein